FFDENGTYTGQFTVGVMPQKVSYSPNGTWVMVACEGVPNDSYTIDPIGSVAILNISPGIPNLPLSAINYINFTKLDTTAYDSLIRVYGNNGLQLPSQDLEPQNIGFNPSSTKAYITLQENNAVAIIDILTASLDTVIALGYKN